MRGNRHDANHSAIVVALRQCGAWVLDLTDMPQAGADLLIVARGRMAFVEVKDGSKPPSARALTPTEQKTRDAVRDHGGIYTVVNSEADAVHLVGIIEQL